MSNTIPKIKRFFLRLLIYGIVLLWPYHKIKNAENSTKEFQEKLQINLYVFRINPLQYKNILEDPYLILFFLSLLEIIFGILGIFGVFIGNLVSCFLFILTNLIYFNPLFPDYHISLYNTKPELFLNIGILCSLLMITFYPYSQEIKKQEHISDEEFLAQTREELEVKKKKKKVY